MNYTTQVFLISDEVTAVNVSYEKEPDGRGKKPFSTYKTFDRSLKVGELVMIPTDTRHGFTVVRVEELDVSVDLSETNTTQYKWLAGKIDFAAYERLLKQEADMITRIREAEKQKKRKDLKKNLEDLVGNETIKAITFEPPTAK